MLGPRRIPVVGDHAARCEPLQDAAVFRVDVGRGDVELVDNGTNINVGVQLLYTYE